MTPTELAEALATLATKQRDLEAARERLRRVFRETFGVELGEAAK